MLQVSTVGRFEVFRGNGLISDPYRYSCLGGNCVQICQSGKVCPADKTAEQALPQQ